MGASSIYESDMFFYVVYNLFESLQSLFYIGTSFSMF